jgi:DNA-binding transcriptional ArsR family regulator
LYVVCFFPSAWGALTARGHFGRYGNVKATVARRLRTDQEPDASCAVEYVDEDKVAAVRAVSPAAEDVEWVADRFSALSDPTRIRILHALARAELCVCDLARVAGRSMPATSQQLQILRHLGLVKYRTAGKLAYYSLADAWARRTLETALDDVKESRR